MKKVCFRQAAFLFENGIYTKQRSAVSHGFCKSFETAPGDSFSEELNYSSSSSIGLFGGSSLRVSGFKASVFCVFLHENKHLKADLIFE